MEIFKRAFADTWVFFGGWTAVLFLAAIPIIGLFLHYLFAGEELMSAELNIWLIYGLAATGVAFMMLFLWNLACAPYRIERDAHIATKNLQEGSVIADSLKSFIDGREYFTLNEAACIKANQPISNGDLFGPASGYLGDLIRKIRQGELKPYRVENRILSSQLDHIYKYGNTPIFGSDVDYKAYGKVELSKTKLIELGFISEPAKRQ